MEIAAERAALGFDPMNDPAKSKSSTAYLDKATMKVMGEMVVSEMLCARTEAIASFHAAAHTIVVGDGGGGDDDGAAAVARAAKCLLQHGRRVTVVGAADGGDGGLLDGISTAPTVEHAVALAKVADGSPSSFSASGASAAVALCVAAPLARCGSSDADDAAGALAASVRQLSIASAWLQPGVDVGAGEPLAGQR